MNRNPFSSKTYTSIWLKHFYSNGRAISFPFLKGTSFFKYPFFPLYINIGRNLTKGVMYTLQTEKLPVQIPNKLILIYDVPSYLEIKLDEIDQNLTIDRIRQYPGFSINLEPFTDLDNYLIQTFKRSSRYKLNKYKKKLESCFNIKYKMFYGEIKKEEYNIIFDQFETLLKKRFQQKGIMNNNLDPGEWNFYKDVTYPMILENDATLFVTYNENQIIGVTLNYINNNTLIDAITVFDVDYSKFNLGSVNIMKLIEWCLKNKFDKLDFSKGYFDYKKRWSNLEYNFEYHLIYNKNAVLPRTMAFVIKNYFRAKQYLRDKKLNDRIHKFKFLLNNRSTKQNMILGFSFEELIELSTDYELKEILLSSEKNHSLKKALFEYLYLNNESINDLKTFKVINSEGTYVFQSGSKATKVQLER